MKQEATNTFGDGMIMDLNPLTTPNNVLTSALNATMITYNGNEFVLQNDMGNGRVETAYLPSGYVPVGIKEYGGIIYVASYNPLTNKGQIGSFPSPERNISSEEAGTPQQNINIHELFKFTPKSGATESYQKVSLFPEKSDTIIRPGDKFMLQFYPQDGVTWNDLKKVITDFDNDGENKLLKLRLAVLDSNGNLKDITQQLKRMSVDGKVVDSPEGFFMKMLDSPLSGDMNENDLENLRSSTSAFNVYNNKLSGSLYIIVELNTITSFDVEVYGAKAEEVPVEWIPPISEYSEPITIPVGKAVILFKETFTSDITDGGTYWRGVIASVATSEESQSDYYVKQTDINGVSTLVLEDINNDSILTYKLTPVMEYMPLASMSKQGSINISLLGSGLISLVEWRYYNDISNNVLTISWGMETYLLEGESISNVRFEFRDIAKAFAHSDNIYTCNSRQSYHGSFTESLNYGNYVDSGKLYLVDVVCTIISSEASRDEIITRRFLYTSTVYNEFFMKNVLDFSTIPFPDVDLTADISAQLISRTTSSSTDMQNLTFTLPNEMFPFYLNYTEDKNLVYTIGRDLSITSPDKYPFKLNDSIFSVNLSNIGYEKKNVIYSLSPESTIDFDDIQSSDHAFTMNTEAEVGDSVEATLFKYNKKTIHPSIQCDLKGDNRLEYIIRNSSEIRGNHKIVQLSGTVNVFEPFVSDTGEATSRLFSVDAGSQRMTEFTGHRVLVWQGYNAGGTERGYTALESMTSQWRGSGNLGHRETSEDHRQFGIYQQTLSLIGSFYGGNAPVFILQTAGDPINTKTDWSTDLVTQRNGRWADFGILWWRTNTGAYAIINAVQGKGDAIIREMLNTFKRYYISQDKNLSDMFTYAVGDYCYLDSYDVTYTSNYEVVSKWKDYKFSVSINNVNRGFSRDVLETLNPDLATTPGWETNIPLYSKEEIDTKLTTLVFEEGALTSSTLVSKFSTPSVPDSIITYYDNSAQSIVRAVENTSLSPSKIYELENGELVAQKTNLGRLVLARVNGKNTILYNHGDFITADTEAPYIDGGASDKDGRIPFQWQYPQFQTVTNNTFGINSGGIQLVYW